MCSSRPKTWPKRWNWPRAAPSWKATDRWRSAQSFPCRDSSPRRAFTEDVPGLVDHLFRQEAGKMVSSLTRIFGLGRLDLAEDVVQDTLYRALQMWPLHGVPDNPSAWLMRAARNRAIDLLRRDDHLRYFTPEL
ncbi:MAG TPA: sigma factor, partial [Actinomycetota bacterium]|nr:sigma factor [Actinomycetota bacterium]